MNGLKRRVGLVLNAARNVCRSAASVLVSIGEVAVVFFNYFSHSLTQPEPGGTKMLQWSLVS